MFDDFKNTLKKCKIVPVVTIFDENTALSLADALLEGGINAVEIAFRTIDSENGLKKIASCIKTLAVSRPQLLVGAGTVINADLAQTAADSGAKFIVSPGFNPATIEFCLKNDIPICPGINAPTFIELALNYGLDFLKFFPAELSGGVKMLKAFSGPFPQVSFMPTGGVSRENLCSYLACKNVCSVGGTWMANSEMIKNQDWQGIAKASKEAVNLAFSVPSAL